MTKKERLVAEILELSEEDREEIFDALLGKIEHPPALKDDDYAATIKRRVEELRSGKAKTIKWSELKAKWRARRYEPSP